MEEPEIREAIRRPVKSESAFRTISEVSDDLEVPQHVLRFWESKFSQIKPLKRGGGRRYYRPEDVQLLSHIRDLLYKDGYTIRGVQKLLREPAPKPRRAVAMTALPLTAPASPSGDLPSATLERASPPVPRAEGGPQAILHEIRDELLDLRRLLTDARRK